MGPFVKLKLDLSFSFKRDQICYVLGHTVVLLKSDLDVQQTVKVTALTIAELLASILVTISHNHPVLILVSKAGANPNGASWRNTTRR